jgi:hypothetical protein
MLFKFISIIALMLTYRASRTFGIALCCAMALCALTPLLWRYDMTTARAEDASKVPPKNLFQFLKQDMKFSEEELSAVKQGKLVTKLVDTDAKEEIAIFSITRVDIPRESFLKHYAKDVDLIETSSVLKMGFIGDPPKLTDLKGLKLDPKDIQAIKDCKAGDCNIKLSSKMMERFHKEIDWSKPDYEERVNELFQQMLIEYVQVYSSGGNSALIKYDDQRNPVHVGKEFGEILQGSPYLYKYVPEFYKYLETFPEGKPSGVKNLIYWVKEDIGTNYNVVSLNHVMVYIPDDPVRNPGVGMASKQIYADHYFEGALGLTMAFPNPETDTPSMYLAYLNRSLIDALRRGGIMSGTIRKKIQSGLIGSINQRMKTIKAKSEALYKAEKS